MTLPDAQSITLDAARQHLNELLLNRGTEGLAAQLEEAIRVVERTMNEMKEAA